MLNIENAMMIELVTIKTTVRAQICLSNKTVNTCKPVWRSDETHQTGNKVKNKRSMLIEDWGWREVKWWWWEENVIKEIVKKSGGERKKKTRKKNKRTTLAHTWKRIESLKQKEWKSSSLKILKLSQKTKENNWMIDYDVDGKKSVYWNELITTISTKIKIIITKTKIFIIITKTKTKISIIITITKSTFINSRCSRL